MPFALAKDIFGLISLFFCYRDNFWVPGSKGNRYSGERAQRKVNDLLQSEISTNEKEVGLKMIEKVSKDLSSKFETELKIRFKSTPAKQVKSFLNDLYVCQEDALQQLYFALSLDFVNKTHFCKLVRAWKEVDEENIARFCRDAYFHLKECGPLGTLTVRELRKKRKFRIRSRTLSGEEFREEHGITKLDFMNMNVDDDSIPFQEFLETGLRFCTMDLFDAIDKKFSFKVFEENRALDLTPKGLNFVCIISETIPKVDLAFVNAPFESAIAGQIYPKVWEAYRLRTITELIFIGANTWFSEQTQRGAPKWKKEAWKNMETLSEFIEIKYVKMNFIDGTTQEVIDGDGYCVSVVHCKPF